jgi:hypothetical protein
MVRRRRIEVFSADCSICEDTIQLVNRLACPSCEVTILEMRNPAVTERAERYGVRSVPAVAIDGVLAQCCVGGGPDETVLRTWGLGEPI